MKNPIHILIVLLLLFFQACTEKSFDPHAYLQKEQSFADLPQPFPDSLPDGQSREKLGGKPGKLMGGMTAPKAMGGKGRVESESAHDFEFIAIAGQSDGIEAMIKQDGRTPDRCIIDLYVPDMGKRLQRCEDEAGIYRIGVKLNEALHPDHTVFAQLPSNTYFDSVVVEVPALDSIVLLLYAGQAISGTTHPATLEVQLYLQNNSGSPLPPPWDLISRMAGWCGIEVVIMPDFLTLPNVNQITEDDLFRVANFTGTQQPVGPSLARVMLSHVWHYGEIFDLTLRLMPTKLVYVMYHSWQRHTTD